MTGPLLTILTWLVGVAALTTQNTVLGLFLYLAGWAIFACSPNKRTRW